MWKNGIINVSSNNQTWASFFSNLELKGHTTYTLTYVFSNTGNAINYLSISDGSKDIATTNNGRVTFTTGNAGAYDFYYHASKAEATTGTSTYKNIMLNEGTTPLPYQAYEGKTIHEKDLGNYTNIYNVSQLYQHRYKLEAIPSNDTIYVTCWSTQNTKILLEDITRYAFSNVQVYNSSNDETIQVIKWASSGFRYINDSGNIDSNGYTVTNYYINGEPTTY